MWERLAAPASPEDRDLRTRQCGGSPTGYRCAPFRSQLPIKGGDRAGSSQLRTPAVTIQRASHRITEEPDGRGTSGL